MSETEAETQTYSDSPREPKGWEEKYLASPPLLTTPLTPPSIPTPQPTPPPLFTPPTPPARPPPEDRPRIRILSRVWEQEQEDQREIFRVMKGLKETQTRNMAVEVTRKVETDKWKSRVDQNLQGLAQCLQTLHLHNPKTEDYGTPQGSQGPRAPLMITIEAPPPYTEVNEPLQECIEGALAMVGPPARDLIPPEDPAVDMTPDEADWQENCYPPPSKCQWREYDYEENTTEPQGAETDWSRSGTVSTSETEEPPVTLPGPIKQEDPDYGEAFQAVVLAGNTPLNFVSVLIPADYQ